MSRYVSHHPTRKGIFHFHTDTCFGDVKQIPNSWDINPNPCESWTAYQDEFTRLFYALFQPIRRNIRLTQKKISKGHYNSMGIPRHSYPTRNGSLTTPQVSIYVSICVYIYIYAVRGYDYINVSVFVWCRFRRYRFWHRYALKLHKNQQFTVGCPIDYFTKDKGAIATTGRYHPTNMVVIAGTNVKVEVDHVLYHASSMVHICWAEGVDRDICLKIFNSVPSRKHPHYHHHYHYHYHHYCPIIIIIIMIIIISCWLMFVISWRNHHQTISFGNIHISPGRSFSAQKAGTLVEDAGCSEGFVAYFADCPRERTAAHLLDSWQCRWFYMGGSINVVTRLTGNFYKSKEK